MKLHLTNMILSRAGEREFTQLIFDDEGEPLSPLHALDFLIMEYAKVRNGGESNIVVIPSEFKEIEIAKPPR